VPIGVGLRAGSHFTSLHILSLALPQEHIRLVHTGGPGTRLVALLDRAIEAATLLDPEIAIAEAQGLRKLAQGEFRITFWVAPGIPQPVLGAYFRALRRADEALTRTPERYLHLWERNVPPALTGDYDYTTFGLGEKMIFEPYSEAMFAEAMAFAGRWGLLDHVQEERYRNLIAPAAI
jgi:NitT/TauT family transport system substrate-binding protein